jgi:hypothetical protein
MQTKDGITRIHITDEVNGKGAHRFEDAKKYWHVANKLYRQEFDSLGMPLLPGECLVECTKAEFEAGYDCALGIDVILSHEIGAKSTLQEKFLFTKYNTVTIEHMQDWVRGIPGDWFNLKAQYYFVGYDEDNKRGNFYPWMILKVPEVQRETARRRIPWKLQANTTGGGDRDEKARASFMACQFYGIPSDCVLAKSQGKANPLPLPW